MIFWLFYRTTPTQSHPRHTWSCSRAILLLWSKDITARPWCHQILRGVGVNVTAHLESSQRMWYMCCRPSHHRRRKFSKCSKTVPSSLESMQLRTIIHCSANVCIHYDDMRTRTSEPIFSKFFAWKMSCIYNMKMYMHRAVRRSSAIMSVRRTHSDDLWRHTREPIKAPLLQRLQYEKEPFEEAVSVFTYILKVSITITCTPYRWPFKF